jgi:hypothetical protein
MSPLDDDDPLITQPTVIDESSILPIYRAPTVDDEMGGIDGRNHNGFFKNYVERIGNNKAHRPIKKRRTLAKLVKQSRRRNRK